MSERKCSCVFNGDRPICDGKFHKLNMWGGCRACSHAEQCHAEPEDMRWQPDKGPWHCINNTSGDIEAWKAICLQSDHFHHDVRLYIDGDFGSREDKLAYANELAARMNLMPAPKHQNG